MSSGLWIIVLEAGLALALVAFLVWRDVKVRYKQTWLGVIWAVIQPVATMVLFSVVFGHLAKLPSDGIPYPIFAYAGLLPWQLFATALTNSSGSVVGSSSLISKVYFPRLVVPIASVASTLVDFAISFVVQFWMFASPVAYSPSLISRPIWRVIYGLNPMAGVIDGFRWALTGHGQPPGVAMAASAVGVAIVLVGGLFFFQRMETNIADRV